MHELAAVLRETLLNLRGKQAAVVVTLLMVSLSFVVFDTFLVITWNIRSILRNEQENVGIEAFLNDSLDGQSARALADVVTGMEGVRSVYYVSPEEAEALFRAELPDKADLLDMLGDEFRLPASLQISLLEEYRTEERVSALAGTLDRLDGVSDVVWGESYLPGLNRVVRSLQRLDIFAGAVLVLSISLVVANTVRLAVARRSLTVEVMSVFGASDWFLKAPFLLEGVATGLLGSAGGLAFTAAASVLVSASVSHGFLPGRWMAGVLLLGAVTGFVGSWIGLRSGIPRPRR
jgi:cell division transport system permease protein